VTRTIAVFLGVAAAAAAGLALAADEAFVPPPGFKKKMRGQLVVYCSQTSTSNTRLPTTVCYDETQMRAFMVAQQSDKVDLDRMRATQGILIH
jgi:hypothetical protein